MEEFTADLAFIACAQKVEHYEISGYGTARSLRDNGRATSGKALVADSRRRRGRGFRF